MQKFAFMVHPREISDLGRVVGKACGIGEEWGMKLLPKRPSEWLIQRLSGRYGFGICSHFDVHGKVEGYIMTVLLTARQMLALPRSVVLQRIMDAIVYAQNELGVSRVGLGAYTAPMTINGLGVAKDKRITCSVTHGDALSAASAVPAVIQGAALKQIDLQSSTIAVVGAYGLVGRAASILLADLNPKKLIMTGPNANKLQKAAAEMSGYQGTVICSTDNAAIKEADVVVLCTTANGDIATSAILKKNAIVVDMAQPHNMSAAVCKARPDLLRVDGGYMAIPGVDVGIELGPPKGSTFACLTETMVSTMAGITDNHVGPVDVPFARSIVKQAEEFGFSLAPLTNFSQPIRV